MNKEEINYCLEHFKNNKVGYCFANGFEISLFKVFEQLNDLDERINEAVEILGEYKHYSTPTEEQNRENEDVVDKAYEILKGGSNEKDPFLDIEIDEEDLPF